MRVSRREGRVSKLLQGMEEFGRVFLMLDFALTYYSAVDHSCVIYVSLPYLEETFQFRGREWIQRFFLMVHGNTVGASHLSTSTGSVKEFQ